MTSARWRPRLAGNPPLRAPRQAAQLFLAAGLIGWLTDFLPDAAGHGVAVQVVLDSVNVVGL